MSLKNWSTTAASNNSAPPNGAPESSTTHADVNDILRQVMADVRTLAARDTIAAASTTDLGSKDATFLTLTGTATTITAFGTVSDGIYKLVYFNAAHAVTHHATSMILRGGASRTYAAGDISMFESLGSGNWREVFYSSATVASYGDMIAANNLSDLADASTARDNLGVTIGTDVQAYDADTLKADTADNLTAGFTATPYNAGTKSSGTYTPDAANGNLQYAVNGGAHTLAPMSSSGTVVVQYTNNASAGAVTTSGFDKVSGSFTTTNGDDFMCYLTVVNTFSHLTIVALQ